MTEQWAFIKKLNSLNYNILQALMLWLTNTSALQIRHLLTKYTWTHLTSRHLHTLALDSISLYTLVIYGTHFTSYNFTPLSLGALWHSSLHTLHKSLTHLTSLTLSHTSFTLISHTSLPLASLISLVSHTTSHTTASIYTRCMLVRKPTWSF